MGRLIALLVVVAFVLTPVAALAQDQEPYSSSTTDGGTLPPEAEGPGTPEMPYTGFGLVPFFWAMGGLLLFGATALYFSRRARAKADD